MFELKLEQAEGFAFLFVGSIFAVVLTLGAVVAFIYEPAHPVATPTALIEAPEGL